MSNSDDFEAIKTYFGSQTPKTAAGVDVKTAFLNWYPTISTLLGVSDANLSMAKKYRDDYNKAEFPKTVATQANQPQLTEEEKDYVLGMPVVNTTGLTAEQAHAAVWAAPRKEAPAGSAFVDKTKATAVGTTTHKTIRQGSNASFKPDIIAWQNIIGIKADGIFGAQTKAATIAWQKKNGLTADGVVGPATWGKAAELAKPVETAAAAQVVAAAATVPPAAKVAAATGQNTVKPAVAAAKPADKATVAAVTTGSVTATPTAVKTTTGAPETTFSKAVENINAKAKVAEAGMLNIGKKTPVWAWAAGIGVFVAAAAYAIFGKPKFDQRKKLNG